jgi:hypothetical protein
MKFPDLAIQRYNRARVVILHEVIKALTVTKIHTALVSYYAQCEK